MDETQVVLDDPNGLLVTADGRTALVVSGTVRRRGSWPSSVRVRMDGQSVPTHGPEPRLGQSGELVAGFSAVVIPPAGPEPVISLDVVWPDSAIEVQAPEHHALDQRSPRSKATAGPGKDCLVAICMATYEPRLDLFARQIESIRGQSLKDWHCLIQDDGSSPEKLAEIRDVLGNDSRFSLVTNRRNLGFYRNFEAALGRVPPSAQFVALADQDDYWYPARLHTLIRLLDTGPSWLVFHDMRVVDTQGSTLMTSLPLGKGSRHDRLDAVLMSNVVTGTSALFRADLLVAALPFPEAGRQAFHDHWLACCAVAQSPLQYCEEPLSDYVQHGSNVIGFRDRGWRRRVQVAGAVLLSPVVAVLARSPTFRVRQRRALSLLLNDAGSEYASKTAFARTLEIRGLMSAGSRQFPGSGRSRWLLRSGLALGEMGGTYRLTAWRLLAASLTQELTRAAGRLLPGHASRI